MILNRISTIPDEQLEGAISGCIEVKVGEGHHDTEFALDPQMLNYSVEHLGAFLAYYDDLQAPTQEQKQAMQMALGALCTLVGAISDADTIWVEGYLKERKALRDDAKECAAALEQ